MDTGGNAYITGYTQSDDFPLVNAIQNTLGGFGQDGFVVKLNATGTDLVFSTYLGGDVFGLC